MKKMLIWGTGSVARELLATLDRSSVAVVGLADNNPGAWGQQLMGIPVLPPDQLGLYRDLPVVVTSRAFAAIFPLLIQRGFVAEHIYDYFTQHSVIVSRLGLPNCLVYPTYDLVNGELQIQQRRVDVVPSIQPVPCPFSEKEQLRALIPVLQAYRNTNAAMLSLQPAYQIGQNWRSVLDHSRSALRAAIAANDLDRVRDLLNNYFRGDVSTAMGGGRNVFDQFDKYQDDASFRHNFHVWRRSTADQFAVSEIGWPGLGNPYGFRVDDALIMGDTFLNHYRAYHARRLVEKIDRPVIAEIGGGYGAMAYYLLGASGSRIYLNFDVPDNLLVSSYFLSLLYPEKRLLLYSEPAVTLNSDVLEQYDAILMPHFMLPQLSKLSVDLFVNTISLSEMEYETIHEYIRQINRVSRGYFYHENIAVTPPYKGFPVTTFPHPEDFRLLTSGPMRWAAWDAYAVGHSYVEELYERTV